jgi:hypothetical protein
MFRLFLPDSDVEYAQQEVDAIAVENLNKKYEELIMLAKNRDVRIEFNNRKKIRKQKGKKCVTFKEDIALSLGYHNDIFSSKVCCHPWSFFQFKINNSMRMCTWNYGEIFNYVYDKNGLIDWKKSLNSKKWIDLRKMFLRKEYSKSCLKACPIMNNRIDKMYSGM